MNAKIKIGDTGGPYYTESGLAFIVSFAEDLLRELNDIAKVAVSYDRREDFYHAEFVRNGHQCDVRVYKAFSVSIDGKNAWMGCPIYQRFDFLDSIRDKTNEPKTDDYSGSH